MRISAAVDSRLQSSCRGVELGVTERSACNDRLQSEVEEGRKPSHGWTTRFGEYSGV
jgi:hypothetical protein